MNTEAPAQIQDTTTQPELDVSASIAEISSELFGQAGNDEEKSEAAGEAGTPAVDAEAAVESPPTGEEASEANSAEVQALGAPETWTKEAIEGWATIPPRQQQEILKREADMHRGLEQYKVAAEIGTRYESVVEPYKALLAAEGLDPVDMFNGFAANHYLLSRGTPEQKVQLAANMLSHYGIDLENLIDYVGDQIIHPTDPRIEALEREVQSLRGNARQQTITSQKEAQEAALTEIEAFAQDPAHPYFNELVADIAKLMEAKVAMTLSEAYEKAVYANPVTRQKELDRLTAVKQAKVEAEEQARKDKLAKSQAANVTAQTHHRDGTVPLGSMDDTLNATLAAIKARS